MSNQNTNFRDWEKRAKTARVQQDEEFAAVITAEVRAGRKVLAIRLFWERYSIGLREAKNTVDAWERGVRVLPDAPRKR